MRTSINVFFSLIVPLIVLFAVLVVLALDPAPRPLVVAPPCPVAAPSESAPSSPIPSFLYSPDELKRA